MTSLRGCLAAHKASCLFQRPAPVDFSFNPLADKTFLFWDPSLLEAVKMGDPHTHEFFRLLSLCHTVMSEEKNEGELRDSSASGTAHSCSWAVALPCCCAGLPGQGRWLGRWPLSAHAPFPHQESCTTKLSLRMRGLWSPQPETLVLCSVPVPLKQSLSMSLVQPSPTNCWPYWTSTTFASGCQS